MRIRSQKQLYFKPQSASSSRQDELSQLSKSLEMLPEYGEILSKVLSDLNPLNKTSAKGQVLAPVGIRVYLPMKERKSRAKSSSEHALRLPKGKEREY